MFCCLGLHWPFTHLLLDGASAAEHNSKKAATANNKVVFTAFLPVCITYFDRMLDASGTRRSARSIRHRRKHIQNPSITALLLLPTTYCTGLLVLSQAFFLYAKMHYDHSSTVKTTSLSEKSRRQSASAKTLLFQEIWCLRGKFAQSCATEPPGSRCARDLVRGLSV